MRITKTKEQFLDTHIMVASDIDKDLIVIYIGHLKDINGDLIAVFGSSSNSNLFSTMLFKHSTDFIESVVY